MDAKMTTYVCPSCLMSMIEQIVFNDRGVDPSEGFSLKDAETMEILSRMIRKRENTLSNDGSMSKNIIENLLDVCCSFANFDFDKIHEVYPILCNAADFIKRRDLLCKINSMKYN